MSELCSIFPSPNTHTTQYNTEEDGESPGDGERKRNLKLKATGGPQQLLRLISRWG